MNFSDLTLIPPLLRAVAEAGYEQPSPIQRKAIPPVLAGRDLLGCAQTGTGKTAAFALPILQLLTSRAPRRKGAIRTLVLTPTRELALQIEESFEAYGKYLKLQSAVIFGGVGQAPQVAQLKRGVDILVATPGRLNDLIGQGYIKLGDVEIFVLDEADRMLDMGFVNDVKKVLKFLPAQKQTLLFSATMPKEIVQLANGLLDKPAKVFVTPQATTVERIEQRLYKVDKANKKKLLASLLGAGDVTSALVFTRTKHGADRVVRELSRAGIKAMAIHGNKSQNARQDALARLKNGKVRVLVATDIAARGLDINELSHVFNYDLPNVPETYVHRIGRTGRAGHGGVAISFAMADELPYLDDIEKLIGFAIPEVKDHAWPMEAPGQPVVSAKGKGKNPVAEKRSEAAKQPKNLRKTNARQQPKGTGASQMAPGGQQQKQSRPQEKRQPAKDRGRRQGPRMPLPDNPYENLTGARSIVTKRPVWSSGEGPTAPDLDKGEDTMNRNNRRRGGKNRGKKNPAKGKAPQAPKQKEIPTKKNGVFDFSDEELAEDSGIKVVSRKNDDVKFANFDDFLKNQ